jgi:RNA polymerase sigma factor (sigma-70 family)
MLSQADLIRGCEARDPHLMEQFYRRFAPEMWVVCIRYTRNEMLAEDVMQEGFMKVFESITAFSGSGSLTGWMKRVFINTAINHFRKYYRFGKDETSTDNLHQYADNTSENILSKINADQLLKLLDTLPQGYKMVFNLYAIEGYSHREISEMLGCSEVTSRSQLARARIHLRQLIKKMETPGIARQNVVHQK